MIAQYIIAGAALFSLASAAATPIEEDWTLTLLKRQEPGTPLYACHEDCGNSITLSRTSNYCANPDFLSQYQSCLECAGPNNFNIWRYYGGTLTTAGSACGLSTTPLSGSASSSSVSTAPTSTSTINEPPAEVTTSSSSSGVGASSTAESTAEGPSSTEASSSTSGSSSTPTETSVSESTSSPAESVTVTPTPTYPGVALPTGHTNTTTSTSAEFTGAASNGRGHIVGGLSLVAAALAFVF